MVVKYNVLYYEINLQYVWNGNYFCRVTEIVDSTKVEMSLSLRNTIKNEDTVIEDTVIVNEDLVKETFLGTL